MRNLGFTGTQKPTLLERLIVYAVQPLTFILGLLAIGLVASWANRPAVGFILAAALGLGQWCIIEWHWNRGKERSGDHSGT